MKIELTKTSIYYKVYGEGDMNVIALHGFSVDHRLMSSCLEPVFESEQNYKRIYIDLPGMGRSNIGTIRNADEMLTCIIECIDKIIGDEPFLLIGESYGGYISLGLANYYKEKISGMALICPCIQPQFEKRTLPNKTTFQKEKIEHHGEVWENYLEGAVSITEASFQSFSESIYPAIKASNDSVLSNYQKNGYAFTNFSISDYSLPCCFFLGKQDNVVGYEDMLVELHKFPRASVYILDETGHNLQIEKPTIFNYGLKDWLDRVIN